MGGGGGGGGCLLGFRVWGLGFFEFRVRIFLGFRVEFRVHGFLGFRDWFFWGFCCLRFIVGFWVLGLGFGFFCFRFWVFVHALGFWVYGFKVYDFGV